MGKYEISLRKNGTVLDTAIAFTYKNAKKEAIRLLQIEFGENSSYSICSGKEMRERIRRNNNETPAINTRFAELENSKNYFYVLDNMSKIVDEFSVNCILFRAGDYTYEVEITLCKK
jgi:hypothetical protein